MTYIIEKDKARFKDIADRQNAYKTLFLSTDLGKKILEDLLDECAVERTAFCKGDNEQTYLNMGKQIVGIHISKMLNIQLLEIKDV